MPLRRLPSLTALRAFEAAARRGSFKAAAQELHVTPGAISQSIRALEKDLGVALFIRETRATRLTTAGQLLQPTVSAAFLQIAEVVDQVRPQSAPKLRINSTNALISKWLLPRLHRFTRDHPEVQVHIESELPHGQGVETTADIEIRYARRPPPDLYWEMLHHEYMLVVASPTVLDTYRVRCPKDIRAAPVLHDTSFVHAGSASSWELWAKKAGLTDVIDPTKTVRFEKPPGGQIVDAAIAGVGIAICGSLLVYGSLADGRLVCPFGPIIESGRSYYICCRPTRENEPHIREFLSWAREEAAVLTTLNAMHEASV